MKKELCQNCAFYSAYYKKWSDHFGRLNNGFCSKHEVSKARFDTCEQYKSNDALEKLRSKRLYNSLEQALVSINDIAEIMREKQRDIET